MDVSRNLCNVSNVLSHASASTSELLENISVTLEELRTISSISKSHANQAVEQLIALDEHVKKFDKTFEKIDNLQEFVTSMTQNDEKTTTTPPTTPVLKKAGLCGTCDCEVTEKSTLEEEALVAVRELAFALKNIAISEMLPRTPQLLFINVTTLENHTHCIELTGKGWRIASNRNDCMNGDFRQLDIHTQYYDTLYALLTTISPLYREKFSEQLISKLTRLADEQNRKE